MWVCHWAGTGEQQKLNGCGLKEFHHTLSLSYQTVRVSDDFQIWLMGNTVGVSVQKILINVKIQLIILFSSF